MHNAVIYLGFSQKQILSDFFYNFISVWFEITFKDIKLLTKLL